MENHYSHSTEKLDACEKLVFYSITRVSIMPERSLTVLEFSVGGYFVCAAYLMGLIIFTDAVTLIADNFDAREAW